MTAVIEQRPARLPLAMACRALGLHRSTVYARCRVAAEHGAARTARRDSPQPRRLAPAEREHILNGLNSREFRDQPPYAVYNTLLARGEYWCSVSTMHRLLREQKAHGDRRNQRPAQQHAIPRLVATAPNQVWTWDISKLPTIRPGAYLSLYVVMDLFSRFVLAWMISRKENSALAQQLMNEALTRYRISADQLTIHQDRGAPMIARAYLDLMANAGVTCSHSRPRVSNDNPYSESQFKTSKYQPDYPGRFQGPGHARQWHEDYFAWYDFTHHHSGLAGYTPEQVFTGRYREIAAVRQQTLDAQYRAHPERFVHGRPEAAMPPSEVTINPIDPEALANGDHSDAVNFPTLPSAQHTARKTTLIHNDVSKTG